MSKYLEDAKIKMSMKINNILLMAEELAENLEDEEISKSKFAVNIDILKKDIKNLESQFNLYDTISDREKSRKRESQRSVRESQRSVREKMGTAFNKNRTSMLRQRIQESKISELRAALKFYSTKD